MEERHADVLVVGAGLAGLAAAIEAKRAGAGVVLAADGSGSSVRAQGGVAAAVGEGDSPSLHGVDTLEAAAGIADPAVVETLTGEAPGAIRWLSDLGVPFDVEGGGGPARALEAAHSRSRVVHAAGDRTGAAIVAALRRHLDGVETLDGQLEGLLHDGDRVVGARFTTRAEGEVVDVRAASTVLGSGGYAGLFRRTVAPRGCDGSVLVSALLAGAELADLEFVQFHPTAFAGTGEPFLLTEALRGAGAQVVDGSGRRFLFEADVRGELAPRSTITRAIVEHLGRTGEEAVFLDARGIGRTALESHFGGFFTNCARVGLDPVRDLVPVAPAAHYTMGGIVADTWGDTGVEGLLAAGECARTGVHGANRLASNSLLEAAVFGRRAGRHAAVSGRPARAWIGSPAQCLSPKAGEDLHPVELGALLDRAAGPTRSGAALAEASADLRQRRGASTRPECARLLALLVLEAAAARRESRGAHVRTDFPHPAAEWAGVELVASRDGLYPRRRARAVPTAATP